MAINQPIKVDGKEFYAIARTDLRLKCELQIEMHVNHDIATVVGNAGDLDNRLKTLFDAPDVDSCCCLLENDVIITSLQVEMFRNTASPLNASPDHVRLNIRVRLEPAAWDYVNEPFRQD
jgi:hypothetical protein